MKRTCLSRKHLLVAEIPSCKDYGCRKWLPKKPGWQIQRFRPTTERDLQKTRLLRRTDDKAEMLVNRNTGEPIVTVRIEDERFQVLRTEKLIFLNDAVLQSPRPAPSNAAAPKNAYDMSCTFDVCQLSKPEVKSLKCNG